jgi:hypothetical protein
MERAPQDVKVLLAEVIKGGSFNVFHGDEKAAIIRLIEIVYLNHITVLQPSGCSRLLTKTLYKASGHPEDSRP